MTYTPTTWVDDVPTGTGTPLNAANMNHIESGISAALPQASSVPGNSSAWSNKLLASDTQPAFMIQGSGAHWWGPGGSTGFDTDLFRPSAGVLQTDGAFIAAGGTHGIQLATDGGIYFDPWDTVIYRFAANVLATNGTFRAGSELYANSQQTNQVGFDAGGVLNFGIAFDTRLYRSAASTLKTDGNLIVAGNLTVGGSYPGSGGSVVKSGVVPNASRAQGIVDVAVTFPTAFTAVPAVVTNAIYNDGLGTAPAVSAPVSITTTGFVFRFNNTDSQSRSMQGYWVAA